MFALFLVVSLIVYTILSWMIVYHLRTYTINKSLAHRAIRFFVGITVVLVLVYIASFFFAQRAVMDIVDSAQQSFGTQAF